MQCDQGADAGAQEGPYQEDMAMTAEHNRKLVDAARLTLDLAVEYGYGTADCHLALHYDAYHALEKALDGVDAQPPLPQPTRVEGEDLEWLRSWKIPLEQVAPRAVTSITEHNARIDRILASLGVPE